MRKRAKSIFARHNLMRKRSGERFCGAQLDAKAGKGLFYARCNENAWLNDSHSLFNGSFGKGKAKDKFGY